MLYYEGLYGLFNTLVSQVSIQQPIDRHEFSETTFVFSHFAVPKRQHVDASADGETQKGSHNRAPGKITSAGENQVKEPPKL